MLRRGAGGGTRTHTMSPPTDFESVTSTNSITPAKAYLLYMKSGRSARAKNRINQIVEKALLQGVPAAAAAGIKLNPSFPAACTSEMTPLTKDSPTFSRAPTKTTVSLGAQGKPWFSRERRSSGGNEYPGLHGYKRSAACDDDIEDCLSCCLSRKRGLSISIN